MNSRHQLIHLVEQSIASEQVEETVAAALSTVLTDSTVLPAGCRGGSMHGDRLRWESGRFGDLQPTTGSVFFIVVSKAYA